MKIQSTVTRFWPATETTPEVRITSGEPIDFPDDDAHKAHRDAAQRLIDQGLARLIDPNAPEAPAAAPKPPEPPGADHPPVESTYAVRQDVSTFSSGGHDPQPSDVDERGAKKVPKRT